MECDRDLLCVDCGLTFVFSAEEQIFFKDKGFKNDPKRCKSCKAKREGGRGGQRIETHVNCLKPATRNVWSAAFAASEK
jgi:hypothetical protein